MSRHTASDLAWSEQRAAQSVRLAVPLVRKPKRWIEPGQGGWCWLMGFVIAGEVAVIAHAVLVR
jgi:hypothetical protein